MIAQATAGIALVGCLFTFVGSDVALVLRTRPGQSATETLERRGDPLSTRRLVSALLFDGRTVGRFVGKVGGNLIAIGSFLVEVGASLIGVRGSLPSVRLHLVSMSGSLIGVGKDLVWVIRATAHGRNTVRHPLMPHKRTWRGTPDGTEGPRSARTSWPHAAGSRVRDRSRLPRDRAYGDACQGVDRRERRRSAPPGLITRGLLDQC